MEHGTDWQLLAVIALVCIGIVLMVHRYLQKCEIARDLNRTLDEIEKESEEKSKTKHTIIVRLDGGCVSEVLNLPKSTRVVVQDYDHFCYSEDELETNLEGDQFKEIVFE